MLSSDKLKVNLHSFDRNHIPKTWYMCSGDVLRGAKEIIQIEEKDNYYSKRTIAQTYEQRYSDILPAIRWLEAKEGDSETISDKQLDLINQWIESQ